MIEFNTPGPQDTVLEKSPSSLFLQRVANDISVHCAQDFPEKSDAAVILDLLHAYSSLDDKTKSKFPIRVQNKKREVPPRGRAASLSAARGTLRIAPSQNDDSTSVDMRSFTQRSRAKYELGLRVKEVESAVKVAEKGTLYGTAAVMTPEQAQHRAEMYKALYAQVKRMK